MRNFLTAVALAATFVMAGNAMAQKMIENYLFNGGGPSIGSDTNRDFGTLVLDSAVRTDPLNLGDSNVQNLYFSQFNGAKVNASQINTISDFWVTSSSIGRFKDIFESEVANISNFNLQLGERKVDSFVDKMQGTVTSNFGVAVGAEVEVKITDSSVTVGSDTVDGNTKGIQDGTTQFTVQNDGNLGKATVSGGTFINNGSVTEYNYGGGMYEGTGSITNLVVGGNLVGSGITAAQSVSFASDGTGIIGINGTVGNEGINFSADGFVDAATYDVAGANVELAMSGFADFTEFAGWIAEGNDFTFDIADALSDAAVLNNDALASFGIVWGDDTEIFEILAANGEILEGWNYADGLVSYATPAPPGPGNNGTPEPATLAVLGLGLTGLGLVSRRRRK